MRFAPASRNQRRLGAFAIVVLLALLAIYASVRNHGFVLLDDPEHVSENVVIRQGLTVEGIRWAFTSSNAGFWMPLAWLSSMLDWQLFGDRAGLHHAMNVALHALNALLLFVALRKLTHDPWPCAVVAAFFAIHPLQVESVAWAAERKNVLSTTFWFLALGLYADYAQAARGRIWRYLAISAALAASLMSKQMGVTIPFLFLVLDYWPLGRMTAAGPSPQNVSAGRRLGRLVVEKLPWIALAAAAAATASFTQREADAMMGLDILPVAARLQNAIWSFVDYLGMFLWPARLSVLYPHPYLQGLLTPQRVAAAALLLIGVTSLVVWQIRRRPYLAVGWFWYLGTLVPTIGLVQVGNQGLADRFLYVPMVGLLIMLCFGAAEFVRYAPKCRPAVLAAGAAVAVAASFVSWRQTQIWRDDLTLTEHSLGVAEHELLYHVLGTHWLRAGRLDLSEQHYRKALELSPTFASAHFNLGALLEKRGERIEAAKEYEQALELTPSFEPAQRAMLNLLRSLDVPESRLAELSRLLAPWMRTELAERNRAIALMREGKYTEAQAAFEEALRRDPNNADALAGRGMALLESGNVAEAGESFRRCLELHPNHSEGLNGRGMTLVRLGQDDEALAHFQRSSESDPSRADPLYNAGNVWMRRGAADLAIPFYRRALQCDPSHAKCWLNLGIALDAAGNADEARAALTKATSYGERNFEVRLKAANAHWTRERFTESLPDFLAATLLRPDHAEARFFYGCNLAQLGALAEARKEFTAALPLADAQSPLAAQIRANIQRIDQGR